MSYNDPLSMATPVSGDEAPPAIETYQETAFTPASLFQGVPVPEREFLVNGLVPLRTTTLLSGDGGTGKSLIATMLATSTATGRLWLGKETREGKALLLTAEDSRDELHRRLDAIRQAENRQWNDYKDLMVKSLAGKDALLCILDRKTNTLAPTPLWDEICEAVSIEKPLLVVLDTAADLFGGDENNRAHVRQFISMLNGLAIDHNCAVVLLSHPSVAGMSSGTGLSGSTAWNNSVRSRLYLQRDINEGHETDPDYRILTTKKANYGRTGEQIEMRWNKGVFTPTSSGDPVQSERHEEQVFLTCLDLFTTRKINVSPKHSNSFAPTKFAADPASKNISAKALERAMHRLLDAGEIIVAEHGPPSKRYTHIARTEVHS